MSESLAGGVEIAGVPFLDLEMVTAIPALPGGADVSEDVIAGAAVRQLLVSGTPRPSENGTLPSYRETHHAVQSPNG
jgi:hypothetical protein